MSKIIMLIATCILLITTAIDGNAAPPTQPSVSSSMQKAGGTWLEHWDEYFYPSLPGGCVSIYSHTDQIQFELQLVDANGNLADYTYQTAPGQFAFPPGPYYDPSIGWYDYCVATASYYWPIAPAHGTTHSWIDLYWTGMVPIFFPSWIFSDVVLGF